MYRKHQLSLALEQIYSGLHGGLSNESDKKLDFVFQKNRNTCLKNRNLSYLIKLTMFYFPSGTGFVTPSLTFWQCLS